MAGILHITCGKKEGSLVSLFSNEYIRQHLPENNEVAMELLERVDEIYSENASVARLDPEVRTRYNVRKDMKLFFIEMSINKPHLLEDFLSFEPSLHDLIEWANNIMSGGMDDLSSSTEGEDDY